MSDYDVRKLTLIQDHYSATLDRYKALMRDVSDAARAVVQAIGESLPDLNDDARVALLNRPCEVLEQVTDDELAECRVNRATVRKISAAHRRVADLQTAADGLSNSLRVQRTVLDRLEAYTSRIDALASIVEPWGMAQVDRTRARGSLEDYAREREVEAGIAATHERYAELDAQARARYFAGGAEE